MDECTQELAARVWREMELAPLVGRYLDERQAGVRAAGQYDDLVGECSDEEAGGEAVDLFGFVDVLLSVGEGEGDVR